MPTCVDVLVSVELRNSIVSSFAQDMLRQCNSSSYPKNPDKITSGILQDLCHGGRDTESIKPDVQKQGKEYLQRGLKTLSNLVEKKSEEFMEDVENDKLAENYETIMQKIAEFLNVDTSDDDAMDNFMSVFPSAVTYLHKGCTGQLTKDEAKLFFLKPLGDGSTLWLLVR